MDKRAIERTAAMLRDLLVVRAEYLAQWQARVARRQGHTINQSAVCQVLADYLWANGLHPATDLELPRKLKDRVHRALAGASLSRATLRWFIEAFAMSPVDTAALLRAGSPFSSEQTVLGGAAPARGTLPPRRHETLTLQDWHRIGPDGLPESHRTVQTIRAVADLDRFPYIVDTDAASVRVVEGGRAGEPYALENGLFAVDILLDRPLLAGESTTLTHETTFWYRSAPPQEFRRASTRRIERAELHVQFHHLRLPQQVWWSVWPNLLDPPEHSEPVTLDPDKSVHRVVQPLHLSVAGFRWSIGQRS